MDNETLVRIEKEALEYAKDHYDEQTNRNYAKYSYVAGATSEHSRITELLKEERVKVINECIEALSKHHDSIENGDDYSVGVGNCINILCSIIEALKGKQ